MEGVSTMSNIANVKKGRIKMTPINIASRRSLLTLARSVPMEGRQTTFLSLAVKGRKCEDHHFPTTTPSRNWGMLRGSCHLRVVDHKGEKRNDCFTEKRLSLREGIFRANYM